MTRTSDKLDLEQVGGAADTGVVGVDQHFQLADAVLPVKTEHIGTGRADQLQYWPGSGRSGSGNRTVDYSPWRHNDRHGNELPRNGTSVIIVKWVGALR